MGKILIVDDDIEIAELISDSLMDEGLEVIKAYNGEEAISVTKKEKRLN